MTASSVDSAPAAAPLRATRRAGRSRAARWVPPACAGLAAAVYALIPLLNYRRLFSTSWDNAIFEQAVRGYAGLGAPTVDVKAPGYNFLGDHFSPILAVLSPAYVLAPHAQTLLVAQALLIAVSVLPLGRAAIDRLGAAAGSAITLAYTLGFGFASAAAVDFHEMAFAVPLLAFAGVAWLDDRPVQVAAWSLPLLLVKEDLGITVAVIGIVLLLGRGRAAPHRARVGMLLLVTGVAAALLVVLVVIPAVNATNPATAGSEAGAGYSHFTDGFGWSQLSDGLDVKAHTLLLTFGITAFLALRSPWVLLTLPTLAWRLASDNPYYWGTEWHYSLLLMPVLFVATIDGLQRLRHDLERVRRPRTVRWVARAPGVVAGVVLVVALSVATTTSVGGLTGPDAWRSNPRAPAAASALAGIPDDAVLVSDRALLSQVAGRPRAYWIGTSDGVLPDFVLLDLLSYGPTPIDGVGLVAARYPQASYSVVFAEAGYVVLRRDDLLGW